MYSSLLKKILLKHTIQIGNLKKKRNFYLKKYIITTHKNIDIIKPQTTLTSIRQTIFITQNIAKNKGHIWLINNKWNSGELSNLKKIKTSKKFPSALCILANREINRVFEETNKLKIPTIANTSTTINPKYIVYKIFADTTTNQATKFIKTIIKKSITNGLKQSILELNKKKKQNKKYNTKRNLPRLDSNQRHRT